MNSYQDSALLSARGSRLIVESGHSTLHEVLEDIYHPERNPDGILSLGLAENSLMHDELLQYIHDTFKLTSHDLMYGDGSHGSKRLRNAAARFITRHLNPVMPVESKHIIVSLGVSNILETLAYTLGNSGDGFLVGRPFYGAFPADFGARAKVRVVGVPFGSIDPFSLEAVAKYEETLLRSNRAGVPIKALVLCTPHNPLGRCYTREVIIALMELCQKHSIHLISDEIYALSIWPNPDAPNAPTFTSVLSIDTTGIIDPFRVHALWGMSKDFGANGLRIGFIIDQHNPTFRESLLQISFPNYPSAPADQIAATILSDDAFTSSYLSTNTARIAAAYAHATKWLAGHGIPYTPGGNAGFFVWVNLKGALTTATETAEEGRAGGGRRRGGGQGARTYDHERLKAIMKRRKLSLADALAFGGEEEGWFRIIFTHPAGFIDRCFARLEECLDEYRGAK